MSTKKGIVYVTLMALILVLLALGVSLFWCKLYESKLENSCHNSVNSALNSFTAYDISKDESLYIRGVAEFRTYMQTYFYLIAGESVSGYLQCESLYVDMISNPERLKTHIPELVDALSYLAEDNQDPNGFALINSLVEQLKTD